MFYSVEAFYFEYLFIILILSTKSKKTKVSIQKYTQTMYDFVTYRMLYTAKISYFFRSVGMPLGCLILLTLNWTSRIDLDFIVSLRSIDQIYWC